MFRNSMQTGLLTIFSSKGSHPLGIWDFRVSHGQISTVLDKDIAAQVTEILSVNVSTTYITCPKKPYKALGIRLPFLIMIVKNLHQYFSFEITIIDDSNTRRRFRVSNFQSRTQVQNFCTAMPIALSDGWNQIQFNLQEFTKRAYQKSYVETIRVQINANTRLRRIYFSDRLYDEKELPPDYKLFIPLKHSGRRKKAVETEESAEKPAEEIAIVGSKVQMTETVEIEIIPTERKVSRVQEGAEEEKGIIEEETKAIEAVQKVEPEERGEEAIIGEHKGSKTSAVAEEDEVGEEAGGKEPSMVDEGVPEQTVEHEQAENPDDIKLENEDDTKPDNDEVNADTAEEAKTEEQKEIAEAQPEAIEASAAPAENEETKAEA